MEPGRRLGLAHAGASYEGGLPRVVRVLMEAAVATLTPKPERRWHQVGFSRRPKGRFRIQKWWRRGYRSRWPPNQAVPAPVRAFSEFGNRLWRGHAGLGRRTALASYSGFILRLLGGCILAHITRAGPSASGRTGRGAWRLARRRLPRSGGYRRCRLACAHQSRKDDTQWFGFSRGRSGMGRPCAMVPQPRSSR